MTYNHNIATVAVIKKQRMEEGYCDAARESIMLIMREKEPVTAEIVDTIREHLYRSIDSIPEGMARPIFKFNKLIDDVHVFECANAVLIALIALELSRDVT